MALRKLFSFEGAVCFANRHALLYAGIQHAQIGYEANRHALLYACI